MVKTTWWRFWRRKQELDPAWLDWPPPDEYWDWEETVVSDFRDSWPPSWTDDEAAPSDITEWALLDSSPPVPATHDEDNESGEDPCS